MKVIVCGGRDYPNVAHVWRTLDEVHRAVPITALMHGGATGADQHAKEWVATKRGVQGYVCKADWAKYGGAAGPMRNARMLEWKPDVVVAFPGGRGTADMVCKARAAGVEVMVVE